MGDAEREMKRHIFVIEEEGNQWWESKQSKNGTIPTAVQIQVVLVNLKLSTAFSWDQFKLDKKNQKKLVQLTSVPFRLQCSLNTNTKSDRPKRRHGDDFALALSL